MNRFLLLFALILFSTLACRDREIPLQERIATSGFPDDVGTIMLTSCATEGCHLGPDAAEELDLSSYEGAHRGSDFGAVLVPFEPDWSHVFQHVNTFADLGIRATPVMPAESDELLDRNQVLSIRDWITFGAKDRDGNRYWIDTESRTNRKVFSLCAGSDLIAVSDRDQNLITRFIPVGQFEDQIESPHYIALSPDEQFLYVSLIGGNLLEKYRTDTYERVGRLALGASPALITLNDAGDRAIITHWNGSDDESKISVIDTENMSLAQVIRSNGNFMNFPHGVVATRDFQTIYVCANGGNYFSKLSLEDGQIVDEEKFPIDPDNQNFTQPSQDYKPYFIVLSPDESRLYISCSQSNEVRVFDTESNDLVAAIPVGKFPRLMAFDADNQRLFVACRDEENFPEQGSLQGCVSVINTESLSWEQNIFRVGHRPHGVSLSPATNRLYVSSENTGQQDPPHHPLEGNTAPPGKYNVVDLNTLKSLPEMETELAEFPNALIVVD